MDINILPKPPIQFAQMTWSQRCVVFAAVGFGSGLAPKAPGTFGSAAVLLLLPLWLQVGFSSSLLLMVLMSVVGIWICDRAAQIMQVHDDGRIVWDEFAGQSIALLPLLYWDFTPWWSVLLAFGLFRLFDVWKPWPIAWVDAQVGGGWGIMLDDLIAGLIAAIILALLSLIYF